MNKQTLTKKILNRVSPVLPEGKTKHFLRALGFNLSSSLPLSWLINAGETACMVGTPNISTIEELHETVGRDGRVIVIEAEETNFKRLKQAYQKYGSNIHIVHRAAWSSKKNGILKTSPKFSGDHKIEVEGIVHDNDYRNQYGKQLVALDTVDNILDEINLHKVDFMFIAVNGAELEVLKGATKTIANRLRLWVKGHARTDDGEPINIQIKKFLENHNYHAKITRKHRSTVCNIPEWSVRDGDVYAISKNYYK